MSLGLNFGQETPDSRCTQVIENHVSSEAVQMSKTDTSGKPSNVAIRSVDGRAPIQVDNDGKSKCDQTNTEPLAVLKSSEKGACDISMR